MHYALKGLGECVCSGDLISPAGISRLGGALLLKVVYSDLKERCAFLLLGQPSLLVAC